MNGRCRKDRLPKVGDRFTLGSYDGVVTRTAKRRVTEVRLTPAEKPDIKGRREKEPLWQNDL